MGLRAWRFSNFPHSIATIQKVWDQQVKVSGRGSEPLFEPHYKTFSFGTIVFER